MAPSDCSSCKNSPPASLARRFWQRETCWSSIAAPCVPWSFRYWQQWRDRSRHRCQAPPPARLPQRASQEKEPQQQTRRSRANARAPLIDRRRLPSEQNGWNAPLPNHDLLQLRRIVYPNFAPVPRWPLTESGPEWVAASQRFWAVRQSSPLRLRAAGIEREPDRNGLPARVFQPALSPSSYCFLGSRSPGPEQSSVIQLGLSTSIQQTCSVKQRVLIS
jgi:hypothetical protein